MKPFGRAVSSTRAGGAAAAAAAASSLLLPLLRPPFGLPRRIQHSIARHAHTQAEGSHRSIAVIGAGIAGLTSALHLARHLPRHRIALYEAADRIGGWVQSERAPVQGCKGGALLEGGPRSLRPAGLPGLSMIELISSLGLAPDLIKVSKSHPSAKNRFLYYNGGIHVLPHTLAGAIRMITNRNHPVTKGKPLGTVVRAFRPQPRTPLGDSLADESIESFLVRTLAKPGEESLPLLDYVGSAVLHGIYAADASQLSVKSIFPKLWALPRIHGGKARALLPERLNRFHRSLQLLARTDGEATWAQVALRKQERQDAELRALDERLGKDVVDEMEKTSIVSFPNGIQTLTDAMVQECKKHGVEVHAGTAVHAIKSGRPGAGIALSTSPSVRDASEQKDATFDRVVAALPSSLLAKSLDTQLPNLSANPSSTVCVVNVALPQSSGARLPAGFGFLVPRACAQQGDNPLGLLGVVFDSEAVPGQDDCVKMTMMFGGPYWRAGYGVHDMLVGEAADSNTDTETDTDTGAFLDAALSLLAQRLSLDEALLKGPQAQALVRLSLQRECIPTYAPGHTDRMAELHTALQQQQRKAHLSVIGASYTGVSMNDCVLYARRTAQRIVDAESGSGSPIVTGLEELVEG